MVIPLKLRKDLRRFLELSDEVWGMIDEWVQGYADSDNFGEWKILETRLQQALGDGSVEITDNSEDGFT